VVSNREIKISIFLTKHGLGCAVALALWLSIPVAAQQADSTKSHEQEGAPAAEQGSKNTSDSYPHRSFGGPEGVTQKLEKIEEQESIFPTPRWAQPYVDWKKHIKDQYGVSFGLSAYWLYQKASDSLSSEDDAFGGIYRFQDSWVAFGRGSGHPGRLEWRLENRSAVGSRERRQYRPRVYAAQGPGVEFRSRLGQTVGDNFWTWSQR
jgi:hypothetical protein